MRHCADRARHLHGLMCESKHLTSTITFKKPLDVPRTDALKHFDTYSLPEWHCAIV